MRPPTLRSAQDLGAAKPHATRMRYMAGCRCLPCRAANSSYETKRLAERARGNWNGLVPAFAAREHLLRLARKGIGRRFVSKTSRVAETTLCKIRYGKKTQIRRSTERRILKIDLEVKHSASLVDARPTWVLIRKLLAEGFTKKRIAEELGCKRALQLNKKTVTFRNAAKIAILYRRIMT